MATPKRVQGVSTPKNPHTSTPSRPTASPRPYTNTFGNKTLAYKSPMVKTPTSFHGHSHRVSVSSHPTSTPLAVPAIHDELLNLNSPAAALIASIGNTGLTPMATGQDGLGITAGITSQTIRDAPLPPRNPETERLSRLEQVSKILRTKTAGYGITREGVERVAQIQGFTILWDEENLTIAGNSVDLEITFDGAERDIVRDVQLRLNISGSEEPQLQRDASSVLKTHLAASDELLSSDEPWKNLQDFFKDLEYLGQLDYIDSSMNCFELMSGFYKALSKVWDEEKKRIRERPEANHICQSNVGRPSIDGNGRLGITADYWVDRQDFQATTDEPLDALSLQDRWLVMFCCEKGSPGISANHGWLEDEPLKTTVMTEDMFQESQIEKPNWANPDVAKSSNDQTKDAATMLLEGPDSTSVDTLNLVFTGHLDRMMIIPIGVASGLNSQYPMVQIDQSKALTYQQALFNDTESTRIQEVDPSLRRTKSTQSFDEDGERHTRTHSYALFGNGVLWSYPLSKFQFSHPRQYADILPILRQYALLWSILRNTVVSGTKTESAASGHLKPTDYTPCPQKPSVKRRSNKTPFQDALRDILSPPKIGGDELRIDLSLDLLTDVSKAKLEVVVCLPHVANKNDVRRFMYVTIEIRRNGLIDIPVIGGLGSKDEEKLKRKAIRVLGLSEDVSVLVEWLLHEAGYAS